MGSKSQILLRPTKTFTPRQLPNLKLWLNASAPGSVQAKGASQFTAASSQSLSRASNSSLQIGDIDAWWAGWLYFDTLTPGGQFRFPFGKRDDGSNNREYSLTHSGTTNRLVFEASSAGTAGTAVAAIANTFGAYSIATWYFVMMYHDSVNDLIGISINGGAFDTTALSGGIFEGTSTFRIGAYQNSPSLFWDGRLSQWVFGKSPVGGIAALTTTIRNTLYNSGNGLDVGALTAAQQTAWGVISGWRLQEAGTGTRADSYAAANTLTNNNSVSGADGPFYMSAINGDPVARWLDQSGQGNHVTQATASLRPIYKTAIVNGRPVVRFDGTDDRLASAAFTALSQPSTIVNVAVRNSGNGAFFDGIAVGNRHLSYAPPTTFNMYAGTDVAGSARNTDWNVFSFLFNTTASFSYVNGVVSVNNQSVGTNTLTGVTIGTGYDGTSPLNGDVAEYVLANTLLSAGALKALEKYEGAKYGIAVS